MVHSAGTTRTAYTPSPWAYRSRARGADFEILAADATRIIATVKSTPQADREANVRLIAASPDLLETLRTLLPYAEEEARERLDDGDTEGYNQCQQDIIQARAAIRAATGETV